MALGRMPSDCDYDSNDPLSWRMHSDYVKRERTDGWANNFMPTPLEIQDRILLMRQLELTGLPTTCIDCIMIQDLPPHTIVLYLLECYGNEETTKRIVHFLQKEINENVRNRAKGTEAHARKRSSKRGAKGKASRAKTSLWSEDVGRG